MSRCYQTPTYVCKCVCEVERPWFWVQRHLYHRQLPLAPQRASVGDSWVLLLLLRAWMRESPVCVCVCVYTLNCIQFVCTLPPMQELCKTSTLSFSRMPSHNARLRVFCNYTCMSLVPLKERAAVGAMWSFSSASSISLPACCPDCNVRLRACLFVYVCVCACVCVIWYQYHCWKVHSKPQLQAIACWQTLTKAEETARNFVNLLSGGPVTLDTGSFMPEYTSPATMLLTSFKIRRVSWHLFFTVQDYTCQDRVLLLFAVSLLSAFNRCRTSLRACHHDEPYSPWPSLVEQLPRYWNMPITLLSSFLELMLACWALLTCTGWQLASISAFAEI
jgi:hypothetical protein